MSAAGGTSSPAAAPGRGPAAGLSLAACRASGCGHIACRRAAAAHERLTPPVPAAGSRRRLRALAWNGFSPADLARRLDEPVRVVRTLLYGAPRQVSAHLAARIAALYDDLWDMPGPSWRTAEAARRRNFAPALGWDDDLPGDPWYSGHGIDDPEAVPAPGWQRRERRPDEDLLAELRELTTWGGLNLNRAALRVRMSGATLTRLRDLVGEAEPAEAVAS